MSFFTIILSLLIGYLFGCFQTSYFLSKWISNKDIREIGSGNAGASNVTSELGWKYGVLTGILDILKAYIHTQISIHLLNSFFILDTNFNLDVIVLAGTGAVLGHIFPFFLKFRGGKGVASYIGMFFAIDPILALGVIFSLALITIITDYVAIGSIILYLCIPIFVYQSGQSEIILYCTIILFIVGMFKHWINIQRIVNQTEIGLRSVYKKNNK